MKRSQAARFARASAAVAALLALVTAGVYLQHKWKARIAHYSVGKKGHRDEEETAREHSIVFRLLQKFRAGCEGSISVLKRAFGLVRCLNRGFNSFASSIGNIVFCHNLVILSRL